MFFSVSVTYCYSFIFYCINLVMVGVDLGFLLRNIKLDQMENIKHNKNRKEIKKLWIQLDRDKHLLAMLKEEYDISTDEFEQYVISNTIATIAKRIMAKRMEIENLKG